MRDLLHAALEIQEFCIEQQWEYCFIGGLAVIRWGDQRTTRDADLTIFTGFGNEEAFIATLLDRFQSRIEDMMNFGIRNRVVLLTSGSGYAFDVSLGGFEFEEQMIQRSSMYSYSEDIRLKTCSAEDLVLLKAFAGRDIDWADVRSVVFRQRKELQWNLILETLPPLLELKKDESALPKLDSIRAEARELFGDA